MFKRIQTDRLLSKITSNMFVTRNTDITHPLENNYLQTCYMMEIFHSFNTIMILDFDETLFINENQLFCYVVSI